VPDSSNERSMFQRHIDSQMGKDARQALSEWEQSGWREDPFAEYDDAPLKYVALVMIEAIRNKCVRINMDMDSNPVIFGDTTYSLPKAPASYIARGLEILREIASIHGASAKGSLIIGFNGETLEVIVQKEGGRHTLTIPKVASLSRV